MGPPIAPTAKAIRESVERTTTWAEARTSAEAIAAALAVAVAAPDELLTRMTSARRIILTGAGSSLYIAQVAATAMTTRSRLPAVAAPLSELLLRPGGVLASAAPADQLIIVVSRSGTTSEAVEVVRVMREQGHPTLAVTCRPGSAMAELADVTLAVPEGDERAVVMTRSFAALATLLMRLGARLGDPASGADLDRLPSRWRETEPHVERAFELAARAPTRVVVLGGGAAFGLANEAALKLTETSRIPAAAYHPLEFRHGPISVCEPGVVVVGILGGGATAVERRVLEECAVLGATTWELGPAGPGHDLGEVTRLPLVLHALQALALGIAVQRGADPDQPRHLGQVVVLRR
jgi:glucosamine--fructose-6-phosphate aminotransferase (isomerizing)